MTKLYGYHLPNGHPPKPGDSVELVCTAETPALFDAPAPVVELSPCTGAPHEHRWIRFGKNGERDEAIVLVDADGHVDASEQLINQLMTDAGYTQHDPDRVEVEAKKRLDWARSRLQEALNRRSR